MYFVEILVPTFVVFVVLQAAFVLCYRTLLYREKSYYDRVGFVLSITAAVLWIIISVTLFVILVRTVNGYFTESNSQDLVITMVLITALSLMAMHVYVFQYVYRLVDRSTTYHSSKKEAD